MLPRVNGGPAGAGDAARQLTKREEERRGGGMASNTHARTCRTRTPIIAWHNIKRRLTAITQVSHAPPARAPVGRGHRPRETDF